MEDIQDGSFPYTVRMRDAETGEERTTPPYNFPFGHFWWTEGNMGCGCNRQAEWHRSSPTHNEEEWVEGEETIEGYDNWNFFHPELGPLFGQCRSRRYEALWADLADGTRKYIDMDDPAPKPESDAVELLLRDTFPDWYNE
jgi:hypothetical protein